MKTEKKKLRGDRNQCPSCGEYFNSVYAFDKHRKGSHGVDRHCLNIEQMSAIGMDKNLDGFWISEKNSDLAERGVKISA